MPAASAVGLTLAHSPQVQSTSGLSQEKRQCQGQGHCQIGQKSVGEKNLSDDAKLGQSGNRSLIGSACHCHGNLSHSPCQLCQGTAEEVAEANPKGGKGKTCHVLVGPQRDGQYTVYQSSQGSAHKGAHKGNQKPHQTVWIGCPVFIQESPDQSGNAASYTSCRE